MNLVAGFLAIMLGALFLYLVATGVRRGAMTSREGKVPRDRQPILFWMLVVFYSLAAPVIIFAGLIFIRAWWHGCAFGSTIRTCNPLVW
jgi:hypothetical protein